MRKFTNFFIATLVAVALSVSCSSDSDVDADVDVDDEPVITTTYTVTFESNGGNTIAAQTVEENDCATIPATPSKSGYDFVAWYSDVELLTKYDFDTPVTKDIKLYADWELKSYTVAFYIDYINDSTVPYGSEECLPGDTVSEPVVDAKFGYTFDGWYAEGLYKWDFDVDVVPAEGVTLYATWIPETYNVIYYYNDDENTIFNSTVQFGWTVVPPTNPSRLDYLFDGWYSDITCETAYEFNVIDESNYPVTGNIRLYARWISVKSVATIYFYSALDYTGDLEPIYTEYLRAELEATNIDANPDWGYSTNGEWYTDKECTEPYDFSQIYIDEGEMIYKSLYAKWEVSEYTISFDVIGKETTTPDPITGIVHGTCIDGALIVDCVAPGDYIFAGWYTDTRYTTEFNASDPITSDITLYAKWTKGDIKVYFVYNDGVTENKELEFSFVDDTYGFGPVEEPTAPTRSGYTFLGWFENEQLTTEYNFASGLISDTYIYARWWDNATTDFYIDDVADLCLFRDLVNDGVAGATNVTLRSNLDLSEVCGADIGNWESIGLNPAATNAALTSAANGLYTGTFDGGGYTISNIYCSGGSAAATNSYQGGLFGQIGGGAVVKNVTIKNPSITSSTFGAGAIAAAIGTGNATIENCITEGGAITVTYQAGAILGNCGNMTGATYVIIKDCKNLGTAVSTNTFAGGIVGSMFSKSTDCPDSEIINCYNEAAITGKSNYTGGIVGGTGSNCNLVIVGCHNAGTISKTNFVGGIVGIVGQSNTGSCKIFGSYNTGALSATGANVGGIVGSFNKVVSSITACYNMGTVTSTNATPMAGGIIGMYTSDYLPTLSTNYFITGTATNGNATDANDDGAEPVADVAALSAVLGTMNATFSTYGYEYVYTNGDEYPTIQEIDDDDDDI